jgi:RHS repeat-associated protein
VDELTKQIEPVDASTSITTYFGYDANGNRTRVTDGRGSRTWTTYNPWNLAQSVVEPTTTATPATADRTYTTSYNALRQPATVTEPGGVTQNNTYDELGDLTKQTGAGAETATGDRVFAYDLAGRQIAAATPAGENDFTYDDRGLLLTATGPSGNSSFTYNADAAMTGRTDASGTTSYGYDTDGRLATAADPITGRTNAYGYDNNSNPATITYGTGGPTRTMVWGQTGNLQSDTITNPTGQTVASTSYVYNPEHQIQTKTTTGYAGAGTTNYTYDWAGRLKTAATGTTTTYTYDASGNRTSDGTHTSTYDERDRLTSDGTSTYTYTPRGTTASKVTGTQTTTYTSDAFDQLKTAGSATYDYDALNRLIQRNSAALAYSGTGNDPASDGTATYSRDPDANLISVSHGGNTSAAITDENHNDLTATLNPISSTLTGSTSYDPYGNTAATSGDQPSIGYQSGYTDPSTGQVNMHARWYNPTAGNFTSRDTATNNPTAASANANPYTYAAGDPINQIDPTGHGSCGGDGGSCGPPTTEPPSWSHPIGGGSGGGGSGSGSGSGGGGGGGSRPKPPPPPADPCAHNHHCNVPPSPKPKPDPKPKPAPTRPGDLPPGTPVVIGAPVTSAPATAHARPTWLTGTAATWRPALDATWPAWMLRGPLRRRSRRATAWHRHPRSTRAHHRDLHRHRRGCREPTG